MKNPKCPYCGEEMEPKASTGGRAAITPEEIEKFPWAATRFYECKHCHSCSPYCFTPEAAYAAAMKRDRAKGKWITVSESAWEGGEYKCSACGWKCCDDEFGDDPTEDYRFCPNCDAEMRKEDT